MRSKREIERQLEHFKNECQSSPAETETWIKALEWVLGNAEYQTAHAEYLAAVQALAGEKQSAGTSRERTAIVAVELLLERLK